MCSNYDYDRGYSSITIAVVNAWLPFATRNQQFGTRVSWLSCIVSKSLWHRNSQWYIR